MRPLTIDDALALERVPHVTMIVPSVQGNSEVEANGRVRRTLVYGGTTAMAEAFGFKVATGTFLPPDDPTSPRAVAVLGSKLRSELFGDTSPLGATIRVGGERFRVVGVMQPKGQMIGVDLDDTLYLPTARAMALFNGAGHFEINAIYSAGSPVDEVVAGIKREDMRPQEPAH